MQVFGGAGDHATAAMIQVHDGYLTYYSKRRLVPNINGHWFHLNAIHDADRGTVEVFYNGKSILKEKDRGDAMHYFKCGVYSKDDAVNRMELLVKNIKVYT